MFKIINEIILWIAFLGGLIFVLSFTSKKHDMATCNGLDVIIMHEDADQMISKERILEIVTSIYDSVEHKKISEIPITRIYKTINKNKAIKQSNIYAGFDGLLRIKIYQRKPVLKIFNKEQTLYIDDENLLFEAKSGESARVIIANGNINPIKLNNSGFALIDTIQDKQYSELLALTETIRNDEFLKSIIEQIYVNADKEFELIPKIGKQRILLGNINDYKNKLSKLKAYFIQSAAVEGWTKYKTINLKYKDQVVCEKK
ncbi:cell division protein FtsQ/DivIB [Bacteroidota bacterium]